MTRPTRPATGWPWEGRPGYFTELMLAADFPPGFKAQEFARSTAANSAAAARGRQTALARGHTGTIKGMGDGRAQPALGQIQRSES